MARITFLALLLFLLMTSCAHSQFAPSFCPPQRGQFLDQPVIFRPILIDPQFRFLGGGGGGGWGQPTPYGGGGWGGGMEFGGYGGYSGGYARGPYGGSAGFSRGPYGGQGYIQGPYGGQFDYYRRR